MNDPPLADGLVHYVRQGPYKEHLAQHPRQQEPNLCDSSLHAIDHANSRGSASYNASGVGAVQCRHMLVRKNGVGDLQKGER